MAVNGRRDVPHRDGILDIAADHVELTGPYRDDDIAVPGKAAGRQIVIGDRLSASPVADEVAALRRVDLDALGSERGPGFEAETMAPRRVDIIRMGCRVREAAARSRDPHNVGNERG